MLMELAQSFSIFLSKAHQTLAEAPHSATRGVLRAVPGAAALLDVVESLEDGPEFSVLVEETKAPEMIRTDDPDGYICGKCGKILLWYQLQDGGRTLDIPQ
jgi:hypothetical protein